MKLIVLTLILINSINSFASDIAPEKKNCLLYLGWHDDHFTMSQIQELHKKYDLTVDKTDDWAYELDFYSWISCSGQQGSGYYNGGCTAKLIITNRDGETVDIAKNNSGFRAEGLMRLPLLTRIRMNGHYKSTMYKSIRELKGCK